ncbi:unnamed protein product [Bemisia tabaci]|uniref:E3 ubiquitin-protein ligase listerin n=1 Tax=Bemisia tabaci TaxID=7038 RepID=A0A9P0A0W6_BEMTA|nr:unnamed protein product [Bemisia tabaci]
MGGKRKPAQRTKNNVRPSSSGRSAELLTSAPSGFLEASQLSDGSVLPLPSLLFPGLPGVSPLTSSSFESGISPEYQLVVKKMKKKDSVTRHKALQEFVQLLEKSNTDEIKIILPIWSRLYSTLALDIDHKVREVCQEAHRIMVNKAGRNIAPSLKQLIGPWFLSAFDSFPLAAQKAVLSFEEAFVPNKRTEALLFCHLEILSFIEENVIIHTPTTLTNPGSGCPMDEMVMKYERVVVASLNAYGQLLEKLPVDALKENQAIHKEKLVSSSAFWNYSKHKNPQIRKAWYGVIISLCQHAAYLLSDHVKQVCGIVFANLSDKNATVLPTIWDAALELMVAFDDCWKHVNFNSVVVPKLWSVLSKGAYGNAASIFPKLLPFLSKVPVPDNEDWYQDFYIKFFSNLILGLQERSVQQSAVEFRSAINALFECLQYVFKIQAGNINLCLSLFRAQIFELLESSLLDESMKNNNEVVFSQISALLYRWQTLESTSSLYSVIVEECWKHFTEVCKKPFVSPILDEWKLLNQLKLLQHLKQSFFKECKSTKVEISSEEKSTPVISEEFFNKHLGVFIATLIQQYYSEAQSVTKNQLPTVYLCKIFTVFDSKQVLGYLLKCSSPENDHDFILLWEGFVKPWLKNDQIPSDLILHFLCVLLKHLDESSKSQILSELIDEFGLARFVHILHWCLCIDAQTNSTDTIIAWSKQTSFQSALISISRVIDEDSDEVEKNCLVLSKFLSYKETEGCVFVSIDTFVKILMNLNDFLQRCLESSKISSRKVGALKQVIELLVAAFSNKTMAFDLKVIEVVQEITLALFKLCCVQSTKLKQIFSSLKLGWHRGLDLVFKFYPNSNTSEIFDLSKKHAECIVSALMASDLDNVVNLTQLTVDFIIANVNFVKSDEIEAASITFCAHLCNLFLETAITFSKQHLEEKIITLSLYAELVNGKDDASVNYNKLDKIIQQINLESGDGTAHTSSSVPLSKNQFNLISHYEVKNYASINIYIVSLILRFLNISPVTDFTFNENSSAEDQDISEFSVPANPFKIVGPVSYCLSSAEVCESFKFNFSNTVASYSLPKKVLKYLSLNLEAIISKLPKDAKQELLSEIFSARDSNNSLFYNSALRMVTVDKKFKTPDSSIERSMSQVSSTTSIDASTASVIEGPLDDVITQDELVLARMKALVSITPQVSEITSVDIDTLHAIRGLLAEAKTNDEIILTQMKVLIANKKHITFSYSVNMLDLKPACIMLSLNACKFFQTVLERFKFDTGREDTTPDLLENATASLSEAETDFILISLTAWIQSLSKTVECISLEPSYHSSVPIFINAICNLFKTVSSGIAKLPSEDSFAAEWKDLFMSDVHMLCANAWRTLVLNSTNLAKSVQTYQIMKKLSDVVINVVDFSLIVKDSEDLKKWSKFALNNLENSNIFVQLTSYFILIKLVPMYVEFDSRIMSEEETDEEIEKDPRIVFNWFKKSLDHTQSIVCALLSDFKLGDTCLVAPLTDSYSYTLAYLSLWSVIFKMVAKADSQLRARYTLWIRNENLISNLILNLMRLLPSSVVLLKMHDTNWKQILKSFTDKQTLVTDEQWDSKKLSNLVCWTYYNALHRLPALIRQWWTEIEYKDARVVEDITTRYASAMLCEEELKSIKEANKTPTENFTIKVRESVREVIATYTLEEIAMEVSITLAQNHPLGMVRVESTKAAMSSQHWHNWLKQLTIFLTHQNGSIWDGLMSWKSNIDKRFEGVEECYICFSILHVTSYELPRKNCRTCHKKFHLQCLYKWFMTSNKSTCPICRNLF